MSRKNDKQQSQIDFLQIVAAEVICNESFTLFFRLRLSRFYDKKGSGAGLLDTFVLAGRGISPFWRVAKLVTEKKFVSAIRVSPLSAFRDRIQTVHNQ